MSLTQQVNFDDENNFQYYPSEVEFTGSLARLKAVDLVNNFTQDFASDVGFTYDAAKAEFTGGLVRQKDQRQANATFAANFNLSKDGNWGAGVLTGTLNGGAAITSGKLDLKAVQLNMKILQH